METTMTGRPPALREGRPLPQAERKGGNEERREAAAQAGRRARGLEVTREGSQPGAFIKRKTTAPGPTGGRNRCEQSELHSRRGGDRGAPAGPGLPGKRLEAEARAEPPDARRLDLGRCCCRGGPRRSWSCRIVDAGGPLEDGVPVQDVEDVGHQGDVEPADLHDLREAEVPLEDGREPVHIDAAQLVELDLAPTRDISVRDATVVRDRIPLAREDARREIEVVGSVYMPESVACHRELM